MTPAEATTLVNKLVGSYPSLNLHDPEVYLLNLVSVLSPYSQWAGALAIERVKDRCKFPPSQAELIEEINRITSTYRRPQEAAPPAFLPPKPTVLPREARASYEELKAKYGNNWGIQNPVMKPVETREQAKAKLISIVGEEEFNKIADAPLPDAWKHLPEPKVVAPSVRPSNDKVG